MLSEQFIFKAIDFGEESGRVIRGELENKIIALNEIYYSSSNYHR
jgi:hypothetical protein